MPRALVTVAGRQAHMQLRRRALERHARGVTLLPWADVALGNPCMDIATRQPLDSALSAGKQRMQRCKERMQRWQRPHAMRVVRRRCRCGRRGLLSCGASSAAAHGMLTTAAREGGEGAAGSF
uniref:Uncharacterized protein n=1 Tax=Chlamydomonas euryale TaxID=1486919 RepID=A0A7R9V428_9CHLO